MTMLTKQSMFPAIALSVLIAAIDVARGESVVLQSGNGSIGGTESQITILTNTLYINATNQGGPAGLLFQATITTTSAVPEPASLLMLATRSVGFMGCARRRKTGRAGTARPERPDAGINITPRCLSLAAVS
jgi:hypothetical protein